MEKFINKLLDFCAKGRKENLCPISVDRKMGICYAEYVGAAAGALHFFANLLKKTLFSATMVHIEKYRIGEVRYGEEF